MDALRVLMAGRTVLISHTRRRCWRSPWNKGRLVEQDMHSALLHGKRYPLLLGLDPSPVAARQ
jgi:hypothetical protein